MKSKLFKRILALMLALVLAASLVGCNSKSKKFMDIVETANKVVADYDDKYFKGKTPYKFIAEADKETLSYTITLEILQGEELDKWILSTASKELSGLNKVYKEAFCELYRRQISSVDNASRFLGLISLMLPLKNFEEIGATLVYKYRNYDGSTRIITEQMMLEAVSEN